MDTISRLLEEISNNAFEIETWIWVDILHINHPHSFYARPQTYNKYLPFLQTRGDQPDQSEINIGDIFVFKSKILKCDVRGKIVACESRDEDILYKMFTVDIGYIENDVPLRRIWTTHYSQPVPPLATHCRLIECAPLGNGWGYDATDAMRSYIEGERIKLAVRSRSYDKVAVELYNSRRNSIATLLALSNYSTSGFDESYAIHVDTSQPGRDFYAKREMQVGENIHVQMLSGTLLDKFYVVAIEDYQFYLTDRNNFTIYAKLQSDISLEDLKLNAPIGVLYEKNRRFERGLVKELMPDMNRARLHLVDLGIEIEESIINMKAIPNWYMRVPTKALCCTLHESQTFSNSVAALSYPGVEFQITVKTVGDEHTMTPHVVVISPLKTH